MQVDDIKQVAVIGAGLMGHGIAQEFAAAGYSVALNDVSDDRLQAALANISRNLRMMGKADAVPAALERISVSTDLIAASGHADLVIEAAIEDLAVKRALFAQLDATCRPDAVLASNTSSFVPSKLAPAVKRPERLLVAHFFNPPYLVPAVEIVRGPQTSDQVVDAVCALLKRMGKKPTVLKQEIPGFLANRLQAALFRECLALVQSGAATPDDIDNVVRNGIGRRLAAAGPFEIFDAAGIDVWRAIGRQVLPDIDASPNVSPLVEQKVAEGALGLKSGRGFHQWTSESADELRGRMVQALLEIRKWNEE